MALAIAQDVVDRHIGEPLDSDVLAVVATRLNDAERILKARIPDLIDKAADADYHDNVVMVEADAILRLIRNPEGFMQESDGSYSYMLSQTVASGRLSILDEEWAILGVKQGVFMLSPKMRLPWEPVV